MSKSIYKEAVETLNKYRNKNYNSADKNEVELANAINVILPKYVKQEKLLGLYRQLVKDLGLVIERDTTDTWDGPIDYEYLEIDYDSIKALNTYKQIKEIENE